MGGRGGEEGGCQRTGEEGVKVQREGGGWRKIKTGAGLRREKNRREGKRGYS